MSEKTTQIVVGGREDDGILTYDHGDPREVIEKCRQMHIKNAERAARALAALERGEVEVFHQRGVHVVKNRRRVWPLPTALRFSTPLPTDANPC